MAALTAFYDHVMPHVRGLGTDLGFQAIREAVIDFCERSLIYTYDVPAINIVGGTASYAITPEVSVRIVDILAVLYNTVPLTPATTDELDEAMPGWATLEGPVEYYYSTLERTTVRIVKTPAESLTGGLEVKIAQTLTMDATTVPDWLLERYRDAIRHGALQRLYVMPNKPWSDAQLSVYHGHHFDQEIGRANTSKAKQHTRQHLRVRPNFR